MENVFVIRKVMTDKHGKVLNVLMTNGHSEILEFNNEKDANEMTSLLRENSYSGWEYLVIGILKQ